MTTDAERLAGYTYEQAGIDVSRCRPGMKNCKTRCPSCGPTSKHRNKKDLSVDIDKGQWVCHNDGCGFKGGLILERRASEGHKTGITPTLAPQMPPTPLKSRPSPIAEAKTPTLTAPSAELAPWTVTWMDDRGIPEEIVRQFGVLSVGSSEIAFPYSHGAGIANVKYRSLDKRFRQENGDSGAFKCLYNLGWFQANPDFEAVIVCEGEMDVLACAVAGWPNATTVPDGAQARVDTLGMSAFDEPVSAEIMATAKRIILAVDEDAAGIVYRNVLVEKFGAERVYLVRWPEGVKDANELLMRDGPAALDRALATARPVDLPGIHHFADDIEIVHAIYDGGYEQGASTGWPAVDHLWQWFPGMTYAWTGIPGHGKTTLLTNALANAVYQHGWKVGLFSPEMGPNASVLRKFTQVVANSPILPGAKERLGWEHIETSAQWVAERIFRVDAVRTVGEDVAALNFDELLDRFTQLVVRSGINIAVIDPWIRIDAMRPRGFTETEWIAHCLNKITRWSQRHQVAFVIVNHPRKQETGKSGEDEGWVSPYEMMGSAYWYALADFIIGVKRNKYCDPRDHTFVRTWKVREEDYQGNLGIVEFTFDKGSQRFYETGTPHPIGVGVGAYADLPTNLRIVRAPEYRGWQPEEAPDPWDVEESLINLTLT